MPALGIDLGTTFTAAAIYRNGVPEMIPDSNGKRLILSSVYYPPGSLKPVVGESGKDQSMRCIQNYMQGLKRIIGRSYYDAYVQSYVEQNKRNKFAMEIINEKGMPHIALYNKNDEAIAKTSPEEVASEILKYIKGSAKNYLGYEVNEAVISVPAYFSYAQREATKRAAEQAGFIVLKLISEPVAAAIHYTRYNRNNGKLLMVDLGGGTLDISVINHASDIFDVESIESDMFLGGCDFDELIFEWFKSQIPMSSNLDLTNQNSLRAGRVLHRLMKYAIRAKHRLSVEQVYSTIIDIGDEYEIGITRDEFDKLSERLHKRIMYKVRKCLEAAKLSPSDIDKVVLAGGSTRIPKLKQNLTNFFNGIELSTDLNPDEAIASGASIHAASLQNDLGDVNQYKLNDMVPHTLGIETSYNLMVPMISKGMKLPVTHERLMKTSGNDQKCVVFNIYEGERKLCSNNKKLGSIEVLNLPPGRAGTVKFEVVFTLGDDGILHVNAKEKNTGKNEPLEIRLTQEALCDSKHFISAEEDEKIMSDDNDYEEIVNLYIQSDEYINNLMYDINNPGVTNKKDSLIKMMNKFKNTREVLGSAKNIDALNKEFDAFKNTVFEYLQKEIQ